MLPLHFEKQGGFTMWSCPNGCNIQSAKTSKKYSAIEVWSYDLSDINLINGHLDSDIYDEVDEESKPFCRFCDSELIWKE